MLYLGIINFPVDITYLFYNDLSIFYTRFFVLKVAKCMMFSGVLGG